MKETTEKKAQDLVDWMQDVQKHGTEAIILKPIGQATLALLEASQPITPDALIQQLQTQLTSLPGTRQYPVEQAIQRLQSFAPKP